MHVCILAYYREHFSIENHQIVNNSDLKCFMRLRKTLTNPKPRNDFAHQVK